MYHIKSLWRSRQAEPCVNIMLTGIFVPLTTSNMQTSQVSCVAAEVKPSDLLESAQCNFGEARKGIAALLNSSMQSQLLTDDKVCLHTTDLP